jgi:hypothetical protein
VGEWVVKIQVPALMMAGLLSKELELITYEISM